MIIGYPVPFLHCPLGVVKRSERFQSVVLQDLITSVFMLPQVCRKSWLLISNYQSILHHISRFFHVFPLNSDDMKLAAESEACQFRVSTAARCGDSQRLVAIGWM